MVAAAVALLTGGATAPAGEPSRDGAASPVSMPKQPIGDSGAGTGQRGAVKLGRRKLLAGRPGQRLRVRYRRGRRAAGTRRVRVVLRRVRREDPRHAGSLLGGERVAAARTGLGRRGGSVSLRGLNPQPGPHRVIVFSAGGTERTRLAARRIDVLPQSRLPRPSASGGPVASAAVAAPTPQALALGEVNHDLSYRSGSEAASAIAVDPGDPARVIAGTGDADGRPLAYISDEDLAAGTVTERRFPPDAMLAGGGSTELDPCCEPAVAADDSGNLWMAAAEAGVGGRVAVNRIAAGQATFQQSSAALPTEGGSAQEKPALAVEDGERIAAVWIETANMSQNVVYSECDLSGGVGPCDDPDGWTAPAPVTDGSDLYSMPDLDFAPNGDVYVTWWDYGTDNAVEIDRCEGGNDCETSGDWGADATIADLDAADGDALPLFCPIIAAPGGLVSPSPDVEVGPGGRVFAAYSDLRDNAEVGAESRCTASASDQTFDSFVAASGAPNSFPAANSAVRISVDEALAENDHFLPALSADPSTGEVEASFYSTAGDPGGQHADRVYVSSGDLGASFSAPIEISTARSRFAGPFSDGIDYGTRQGADSADGVFRPAWTDNRALQSRDPDLYALSAPVETAIDAAPSGSVAEAQASVEFSSDPQAPRFDCSLDGAPFGRCRSPLAVGPLPNGPHTLDARATDRAGNVADATPATASWAVADFDPPETTITKRPKRKSKDKKPVIAFEADDPAATFECRYDSDPWDKCRSPKKKKVKVGKHRFRVRAVDVGENADPTPAVAKFKRKRKHKKCKPRRRRKGHC